MRERKRDREEVVPWSGEKTVLRTSQIDLQDFVLATAWSTYSNCHAEKKHGRWGYQAHLVKGDRYVLRLSIVYALVWFPP